MGLTQANDRRRFVMLSGICCGEYCVQAIIARREHGWFLWIFMPEAVSILYGFEGVSSHRNKFGEVGQR
jgi:hypothetical protein